MNATDVLIVVDMQKDFVDGALGTLEAQNIVPKVIDKIKNFKGYIIATRDTHEKNYLNTNEGRHLPVEHCINGTTGHKILPEVLEAMKSNPDALFDEKISIFDKPTFGCLDFVSEFKGYPITNITLVGVCTDICVVSNALLLKAVCPEANITVDASCCAGVTPESHKSALATMKMCQIDIINE